MNRVFLFMGLVLFVCPLFAAEFDTGTVKDSVAPADSGARFELFHSHPIQIPNGYDDIFIWYWLATIEGRADAQFKLGAMFAGGDRVPKDKARAGYWYRRAVEQGYDLAQINLGYMYLWGNGVPRDADKAARLFRLAAEQGHATA